jgi:hypothetical protein
MMIFLVIIYGLILCLFLIVGYTTTPRQRLHLGLFILAAILWPLSLLAVIGHVCAGRLGILSKPSVSGQPPAVSEPSEARGHESMDKRLRQPIADQASG